MTAICPGCHREPGTVRGHGPGFCRSCGGRLGVGYVEFSKASAVGKTQLGLTYREACREMRQLDRQRTREALLRWWWEHKAVGR